MNRIELGEFLKLKRRGMGRTLQEMATSIGVSINYLSTIERGGIQCPRLNHLKSIAKHYRIEFTDIEKVFYPDDDLLDEIARVDREFRDTVNSLQSTIVSLEEKEAVLKDNSGIPTKKFIIELINSFKKMPESRPKGDDKIFS